MAMFYYNNYKLPALYIIPESDYIYSFISIDQTNGFASLTIVNRIGYVVQNESTYHYTLGDKIEDQFGYYSFITALTANDVQKVNAIFGQSDITYYSWKKFIKSDNTYMAPLAGPPIWSNFNLVNSNGQTILEATKPEKITKNRFALRNLLTGLVTGLSNGPIGFWETHYKNNLNISDINPQYSNLMLVSLSGIIEDGSNKAILFASEKPFSLYENYIVTLEDIQIQCAFTDFDKWYKIDDEYWLQTQYNSGTTINIIGKMLWCNYDLINEVGEVQLKGKTELPPFF